ncbi:DNA-methyltransferase [Streptomyces sp. NPDC058369]|uniref:DNA-methyltransferase n=1 Tax=Streptomyces sp. NPDC058369 TaxID=3346462 RepID=UPI00364FDBE5
MESAYSQDESVRLITGNSLEAVRNLPPSSIDCVVTSPPYFGLRDYGNPDQIGQGSLTEYVDDIVSVFNGVYAALKPSGTFWLNVGDTYQSSGGTIGIGKNASVGSTRREGSKARVRVKTHLPDKNLLGIPWRLAFALQDAGWILRSEIIWSKPNPMPESVQDRPTRAFEYVFLLTKSKKYYYNHEAVREPRTGGTGTRSGRNVWSFAVSPGQEGHAATFPVELAQRCITAGCPEGGVVLDPFSGSGTTGVAALNRKSKYIGIDLVPEYHAIAMGRMPYLKEASSNF